MLEHQQVVQVVGRHEGGRAHIDQPSLDQLERRMGAKLPGVGDHVVAVESAGDDGPQQPGGWLDGERDRHGRRRWRTRGLGVLNKMRLPSAPLAPFRGPRVASRRDEPIVRRDERSVLTAA